MMPDSASPSLFIGGPHHGVLQAVRNDPYAVPVAAASTEPPEWKRTKAGAVCAAVKESRLETVMYTRRVVQLLGRDIVIYVDPTTNLTTDDGVSALFDVILTPEARQAVRPREEPRYAAHRR